MGADGHFLIMKRTDWDEKFPDVVPEEIGATVRDLLGVTAVTGYWDTRDIDYSDDLWGRNLGFTIYRQRVRLREQIKKIDDEGVNGIYKTTYGGLVWKRSELAPKLEELEKAHSEQDFTHSARCDEAENFFRFRADDIVVWT